MIPSKEPSGLARQAPVWLVYGATHALVDVACVTMLFGLIWRHSLSAHDYLMLVVGV
jgi:hypothetical protein